MNTIINIQAESKQHESHTLSGKGDPRITFKSHPPLTKLLGVSSNGKSVFDRHHSHVHEVPPELIEEAVSKIAISTQSMQKFEIEMGRVIGKSSCVTTTPQDQIVFAQRKGRYGRTRFAKNRQPWDCSKMFLIVKATEVPDRFVLITCFVGETPEPEPWDRNATPNSAAFWATHALVWDPSLLADNAEIRG